MMSRGKARNSFAGASHGETKQGRSVVTQGNDPGNKMSKKLSILNPHMGRGQPFPNTQGERYGLMYFFIRPGDSDRDFLWDCISIFRKGGKGRREEGR